MTDKEKYPSELAERFQIRMPAGLRDRIKASAEVNGRSMNTEIIAKLEEAYPDADDLSLIDEIDELRAKLDRIRAARVAEEKAAGLREEKETVRIVERATEIMSEPKKD